MPAAFYGYSKFVFALSQVLFNMVHSAMHYMSRGADSLKVNLEMHRHIRAKVIASVRAKHLEGDAIILAGGGEMNMYDSDTVWDFRQESNFQYFFGVKEPGCFGVVLIGSGESILFIPRFPPEYGQWFGPIKPRQWFKDTYLVDHVHYVDEQSHILLSHFRVRSFLYYDYVNRDSDVALPIPNNFLGSEHFTFVSGPEFAYIVNEHRLIKSEAELAIMQFASDVSSRAHIETMKSIWSKRHGKVVGMEHFAESSFRFESAIQGCARVGYHCIACSGVNNAVLHYGHAAEPNNGEVPADSLRLLDMGAEYHCYTADITCTFPTNGNFNPNQRIIYEAVWTSVKKIESTLKPGLDYRDMQRLSNRTMLQELVAHSDIFLTDDVDKLTELNIMSYFCPHGLGHSLGLMVHDVAIPPGEEKDKTDFSLKGLRLPRALIKNMVITVEPGIYFIEYLIEDLRKDPVRSSLINFEAVDRLRTSVGGVRIEDNVVISETGCRVLNDVPREMADVEAVMTGKKEWTVGNNRRTYS